MILAFRTTWIYIFHANECSLWLTYVNPFFRITDYFLGMMLGVKISTIQTFFREKKCYYHVFCCVVWSLFIGYVVAVSIIIVPWYYTDLKLVLSVGMIIMFMVFDKESKLSRMCLYENKLLIYIGNISFELFLIHTQIISMVGLAFVKLNISNDFLKFVSIIVISIILAQLYSYAEGTVKNVTVHSQCH